LTIDSSLATNSALPLPITFIYSGKTIASTNMEAILPGTGP
jgi:hypothetical protein